MAADLPALHDPTVRAAGTIRDWTTPDGKPGLAVDYEIRDGATWGDGTPITTEDVQFTGRSDVTRPLV